MVIIILFYCSALDTNTMPMVDNTVDQMRKDGSEIKDVVNMKTFDNI